MTSKLTIHRGSKEIGGSCVEISTEKARILIDFGIPLVDENGDQFNQQQIKELTQKDLVKRKILPDIKGLYKAEETEISAIFISHAHPDHFGLLNFINPDIPIYTGEVTKSIIQDIAPILYDTEYNLNSFHTIKNNEVIRIDDLSVKSYSIDHSIADSLSFEITNGVKTILYSGDFRSHGRRKYLFDKIIKKIGTVDYLLMEGTTLGVLKVICFIGCFILFDIIRKLVKFVFPYIAAYRILNKVNSKQEERFDKNWQKQEAIRIKEFEKSYKIIKKGERPN